MVADAKIATPLVTDERDDLILSWFADGGPAVGSSVKDVPESARREVRVQDPSIPPENRDPSIMFIADLIAQKKGNRYQVKAVKRAAWEAERRAKLEAAQKKAEAARPTPALSATPPPMPDGKAPGLIMYATKHCPVCIKARRWLLEKKIPYVELDIEKDQAAAEALRQKGAQQGVPTSGVPIFEIYGRLVPGFDPGIIIKMLTGPVKTQQTV
jgi:glutaredoxin